MSGDEWVVAAPHPALRPIVVRYLGYARHEAAPALHRGLPSRHVTLAISLVDPMRVVGAPGSGRPPTRPQGVLGGMHTSPALIAQQGHLCGVHVELHPLGLRALFGCSSAELSEQVIDLADLGSRFAALPPRLAATPDWRGRFTVLDEVLLERFTGATDLAPELAFAWRRMLATGGTIRVAQLAGEIGWSRRHLGEVFRREVGLSPKQAARVLRFERAGNLLRRGTRMNLADLAAVCGYSDQSHLTNEWRALAGCSPGTWIAEELPFLQYDTGTPAAGS
ncbi:hypothetical protein SacmaDRAFT_1389 [Saccharomonospora marina XMU15]|uniref:HTH araC/xylS-type domain-containing protein n=1 Tax=Saccharomonospora marina XMU15 TaxID=882083 RepID=H5X0E3_9PSEU|nr:helix-turn-helix domain-containing protein [Saccharomonospora marina]EHR49668.1 hypothetical protein SacmaDRAFT_1389 [Saccharomonospora marina XMU15]